MLLYCIVTGCSRKKRYQILGFLLMLDATICGVMHEFICQTGVWCHTLWPISPQPVVQAMNEHRIKVEIAQLICRRCNYIPRFTMISLWFNADISQPIYSSQMFKIPLKRTNWTPCIIIVAWLAKGRSSNHYLKYSQDVIISIYHLISMAFTLDL